jgi:hypothetical protein
VKKTLRRFFKVVLECAIAVLPHLAAWIVMRLRQ